MPVPAPQTCPVCQHSSSTRQRIGLDYRVDCPRCGSYDITDDAVHRMEWPCPVEGQAPEQLRARLSAAIRHYAPELLDLAQIEQLATLKPPALEQRAAGLLRRLYQQYPPGTTFSLFDDTNEVIDPAWLAWGWCRDEHELSFLLQEVLTDELHWLQADTPQYGQPPLYRLTARGILRLESGAPSEASPRAFCAMWFDEEMRPLWEQVIQPALVHCGYDPVRLDCKEYNHRVDDEIIAEIRSARFVVADVTGHRGGVYYEAGFAHGLGLPVIFMHRDDPEPDIHFDLRQYNILLWQADDLSDARKRLQQRILATLGRGPLRQP